MIKTIFYLLQFTALNKILKKKQKNSNDNNINKKKESKDLRKIARDAIQGATQ